MTPESNLTLTPISFRKGGEGWLPCFITDGDSWPPIAARTVAFSPNGVLAIGTQEHGLWLSSNPPAGAVSRFRPYGAFRNLTRSHGLPWNYVSALAWSGADLWVGTAGGGFGKVVDAASESPRIINFPQGDRAHRYITRIIATESRIWIATDCGLLCTDPAGNVLASWGREQLGNAYLTALWVRDPIIIVGHLHGGAVSMDAGNSWHPLIKHPPTDPAMRRVRDIKLHHEWWLLATDGGLLASKNAGAEWKIFDDSLIRLPMRRLTIEEAHKVMAATPYGLVRLGFKEQLDNSAEEIDAVSLGQPMGIPGQADVYDVAKDSATERWLMATTSGPSYWFSQFSICTRASKPGLTPLELAGPLLSLSLSRPIASTEQPHQDQTYLFGTTCRGEFPVHQGIDINVPKGTPILSCADGIVVRVTGPDLGNRIFIDHDTKIDNWIMTTVYVHASTLFVKEGQHVAAGQRLAAASDVGRATNSHLHFEVRFRRVGEALDASRLANPELWLRPVKETDGAVAFLNAPAAAEIAGFLKEFPPETAYHLSEAPHPSLTNDSPGSGWLVVSDLPPGTHEITLRSARGMQRLSVPVSAGRLSLFDLKEVFA